MTTKGKTRILWLTFVGSLILLVGGMTMAYSLYKDLEASLREVQTAYANEQGKTEKLTQKAEDLINVVEEGQAREKALRESQRAFKEEKVGLERDVAKLEAAVVRWQSAYSTEQAKTRKLTETAKDLLGIMEQAHARLKSLEDALKLSRKEKASIEEKTQSFETALKRWQTAHAAEQTKNRMLNERAEKLTKIAEQAQDRVQTLEQAEIGRRAKRDFDREGEERAKNWGKDYCKGFKFIFF